MSSCQFFVEDVDASRRYVVTLKPEDIHRVRCRTIRRHLSQSAGFPYLAHEFDLFVGPSITSSARPLDEDASGNQMGLRSGAVLLLAQRKPTVAAVEQSTAGRSPSSRSPRLAEVVTSADDGTDEGWMDGLSERQRQLQAQLLNEFRRSSSESPSPPPRLSHDAKRSESKRCPSHLSREGSAEYVVGKGWVGESTVVASTMIPSRSVSGNATDAGSFHAKSSTLKQALPVTQDQISPPPRRHSESSRYEATPSCHSESPQLLGTSEDSYYGSTVVGEQFQVTLNKSASSMHPREGKLGATRNASAQDAHRAISESVVQRDSESLQLRGYVESLIQRIQTLTSSNEAAQREMQMLNDELQSCQQRVEHEASRANSLHESAVAELKQHLGFKFVKSQSDFDAIVRNFSKRKELETRCTRAADSQKELMMLLAAEQAKRRALQSSLEDLKGNIRVVVRIRPFVNATRPDGLHGAAAWPTSPPNDALLRVDTIKGTLAVQSATTGTKAFEFYRVFDHTSTQQDVFEEVAPLVQCAVDGSNVCVFAYGQTGSGKTHTILGGSSAAITPHLDPVVAPSNRRQPPAVMMPKSAGSPFEVQGLIPRAVYELFRLVGERIDSESCIMCSLVELYNEQLFDLLALDPQEKKIDVRPLHSLSSSMHQVRTPGEALTLLNSGASARRIHETRLNMQSSRSHLVFTMHIALRSNTEATPSVTGGGALVQESKVTFVDLAGSERVAHTQSVGDRLKEAQCINKSLSALGDVVSCLSNDAGAGGPGSHVPYRNSKLTLLLQDCIGGSSKTMLVACIAPTSQHYNNHQNMVDDESPQDPSMIPLSNLQETLSTLTFAARVRLVRNGVLSRHAAMRYMPTSTAPPTNHHLGLVSGSQRQDVSSGVALKSANVNHQRSLSKTPRRPPPMKF